MDMMSMVSSLLAAQASSVQTQAAFIMMKQNAEAEKATVLTLLGVDQPPSLANVAPGVGRNLNITA